ncbi:hypothetical protein ACS0TY_033113 [Phlomoides rotata]
MVICSGEYADDTVFICSGELKNILLIKRLLILFELSSGLNVNFDKSCLHEIQISNDILSEAANILNCKLSKSVFSYLGMEIGVNHHKPVAWEGLIQKVKNCLATWDDKLISFAGRATLIQSVLSALPIYQLSFYVLSNSIIKALKTI